MTRIDVLIFVVLVVVAGSAFVTLDNMHTEGLQACEAKGGTWLDREMKCLAVKELK